MLLGVSAVSLLVFCLLKIGSQWSFPLFLTVFLTAFVVLFSSNWGSRSEANPAKFAALFLVFASWAAQRWKEHGSLFIAIFITFAAAVFAAIALGEFVSHRRKLQTTSR